MTERCALKRCKKRLPELAVQHGDPFHSSDCCRKQFGVVFESDTPTPRARRSMIRK